MRIHAGPSGPFIDVEVTKFRATGPDADVILPGGGAPDGPTVQIPEFSFRPGEGRLRVVAQLIGMVGGGGGQFVWRLVYDAGGANLVLSEYTVPGSNVLLGPPFAIASVFEVTVPGTELVTVEANTTLGGPDITLDALGSYLQVSR